MNKNGYLFLTEPRIEGGEVFMTENIRNILQDLDRVRENMLALSDDIWLSIDHNDPDALREGVEFKQEYNDKMIAFDRLATEISQLVQQFTNVQVEEEPEPTTDNQNDRIIRDLNREEPHLLSEDFTFKRPFGFILCGRAFKNVNTWRRMFELVCRELSRRDPETFASLPDKKIFKNSRGKSTFAESPEPLRAAIKLTDGVYGEVNLSANALRDVMRKLLKVYQIPNEDMTVFLRQDRDAEKWQQRVSPNAANLSVNALSACVYSLINLPCSL
jgi:hypothetical protein